MASKGGPVALGTLFELPLSALGKAVGAGEPELTAASLQALQLEQQQSEPGTAAADDSSAAAADAAAAAAAPRGPTCIACGIGVGGAPGFASAEEQRHHFSLDWHRYNVKRRAARQPPVSEAAFAALVEDEQQEVGSISGSESEDSEDEEEGGEGGEGRGGGQGSTGPQFAFSTSGGCRPPNGGQPVCCFPHFCHIPTPAKQPACKPHWPAPALPELAFPRLALASLPVSQPACPPACFFLPRHCSCRRQALRLLACPGGARARPAACSVSRWQHHSSSSSSSWGSAGSGGRQRGAGPGRAALAAPARRPLGCGHAARRPLCGGRLQRGPRTGGQPPPARQV